MDEDQEHGKKRLHIETTPREAYEFVRKLASDPEFREEVERDPEKALRKHGIDLPGSSVQRPVKLPSQAELEELASWMERSGDTSVRAILVLHPVSFGPMCVVGSRKDKGDPLP